jgi:hypothetical protein
LQLVLTEQPGAWFADVAKRLDSVYFNIAAKHVQSYLPLLPSEYMKRQVFVGASFLAHYEAMDAVENGYTDNVLWGSDYPHPEGTWRYPETDAEIGLYTRASLKMAFAGLPEPVIRAMAGGNAIRVFRLDPEPLQETAEQIGAPSPAELAQGLDVLPPDADHSLGFRTRGPWS